MLASDKADMVEIILSHKSWMLFPGTFHLVISKNTRLSLKKAKKVIACILLPMAGYI